MTVPVSIKDIKSIIIRLPRQKESGPHGFAGEFLQTFMEEITSIFIIFSRKWKEFFFNSFCETSIILILKPKTLLKKQPADQSLMIIGTNFLTKY